MPNLVIQRPCVETPWGRLGTAHQGTSAASRTWPKAACGQGRKWTWNCPWKHRTGRGPGCADIGSHPAGGPRHAEIGKGTDQDSGRAPAGTHVHKDLCNKTIIPGFVRHLQAHFPFVENSQSPDHGSLARPSSQAITPWATQTCNGGRHLWGSNPGPYGLVA